MDHDLEDYIQKIDNKELYKILFRNVAGLSVTSINTLFKPFGSIYEIKETGNETGYRFVTFNSHEAALGALTAYFDHDHFSFKIPHKKPKDNKQYNGSAWDNKKKGQESQKSPHSLIWENQLNNNIISLNPTNVNTSNPNENNIVGSTTSSNTSKDSKKIQVVDSELVVIGNIPLNYSEAYILYLFEKFEPCAITKIETLPNSNMRYCCIYLKSVHDSLNLESEFDKHELAGQKLIVLRQSRLIQEAHLV